MGLCAIANGPRCEKVFGGFACTVYGAFDERYPRRIAQYLNPEAALLQLLGKLQVFSCAFGDDDLVSGKCHGFPLRIAKLNSPVADRDVGSTGVQFDSVFLEF